MGLVLDNKSIGLYEKWLQSPAGKGMDEFAQRMIPELLSLHKNDKVLEIGCGTGNQLLYLSKLGLDISGVDASPELVEIAKERLGNRCELKTGEAEDLPFSDNEFDFALLINTLGFLDNPLPALKEAGRVAKKKVLICVINRLSFCFLNARFQATFRETLMRHIKPYHLWEMKSHIKNAYGSVPVVWKCTQDMKFLKYGSGVSNPNAGRSSNWPFGSMLGIAVTLNPLFRTENLHLKLAVKKAEQPFAEGITVQN